MEISQESAERVGDGQGGLLDGEEWRITFSGGVFHFVRYAEGGVQESYLPVDKDVAAVWAVAITQGFQSPRDLRHSVRETGQGMAAAGKAATRTVHDGACDAITGGKLTPFQNELAAKAICDLVAGNAVCLPPASAAKELCAALTVLNRATDMSNESEANPTAVAPAACLDEEWRISFLPGNRFHFRRYVNGRPNESYRIINTLDGMRDRSPAPEYMRIGVAVGPTGNVTIRAIQSGTSMVLEPRDVQLVIEALQNLDQIGSAREIIFLDPSL